MSDHEQQAGLAGGTAAADGAVESLLRLAGPREPVPVDRMLRMRAGAHAAWRQQVVAHRRRRVMAWSLGGLAGAAALTLAVRATLGVDPAAPAGLEFATVEALGPSAQLVSLAGSQEAQHLKAGDRLAIGRDAFTSGIGSAALRLSNGALLRMEGGTALRLESATALRLNQGAVYLDSGGGASLEVRTRHGVVHDVGTKFEVRLTSAGLRVRVRDGAVQVREGPRQHDARAGEEVVLDSLGAVTRRRIPVDGPGWAWTTGAPAAFELEGHSLHEFLDWIAGENGWRLEFADTAVEDKARTTTLHGSIEGLTPEQALAAVLPTSGVEHQLAGGVLSIRLGIGGKD